MDDRDGGGDGKGTVAIGGADSRIVEPLGNKREKCNQNLDRLQILASFIEFVAEILEFQNYQKILAKTPVDGDDRASPPFSAKIPWPTRRIDSS